jgi:hypothetical protein
MRNAIFAKCRVPAGILIAASLLTLGSLPAQSQNPVDAIKDAWKKAKPAPNGQPAPAQPAPSQRPAARQPATNAPQPRGGAAINDTGPFTPPPGTKIEPVVMAPVQQGAPFTISPHGIHVATLSHSGSRQVVIYDGVVEPKFDQIISQVYGVVFSPDGNRYAYCGQLGNEWVVMVDGKELTRGSTTVNGQIGTYSCMLGFTSNSKHVYFTSSQSISPSSNAARFVFDGKAGPLGAPSGLQSYVFSPDGNHFAYLLTDISTPHSMRTQLFIDGQPAPYNAGDPQWSADSQHLYTKRNVSLPNASAIEVLLDGRPMMRAEWAMLYIPPVGNMVIAHVKRGVGRTPSTEFLVIGGKEVPGSENNNVSGGIKDVTFSPDGKHYSAVYHDASGRSWVFSDGKKGQTYGGIGVFSTQSSDVTANYGSTAFTADSSNLAYLGMGTDANNVYVVYGGQESDEVHGGLTDCLFSPVKNHFLLTGSGIVTLDGKVLRLPGVIPNGALAEPGQLAFSPDGEHYAFRLQTRDGPLMYVDGVPQTAYRPTGGGGMTNMNTRPYIFSPDSKHIAYFCRSANPAAPVEDMYLCLDNKAVLLGRVGPYNLTFSPDSNHLFWSDTTAQNAFRLFVDGKPVLDGFPGGQGGFRKETWQMGPDGTLSLLVQDDSSLKRVSITPSPDTSLATLFSNSNGLSAKH